MRYIRPALLMILLMLFVMSFAYSEELPDIEEIIERVDRLYRSSTSQGVIEMTIVTENWSRNLSMDIWSEGMDKTFIHITFPKKDAGISTLRLDDEMWNFFPKINKVMKVPPSMMMSSWMGSDFTNDDLVKESSMLDDYSHKLLEPEDNDPDHYYVELLPKKDIPTVWGRIVIKVRKEDFIPVREDYYDEKGKKMRVMTLKEITMFGDKKIPAVIELIPLNKENQKTVVRYKDLKFDEKLDEGIFTLRNLQKRR
ncbi:MAG: outer membrane lipoprotein-sorting protein [Nitrospirota bacterium]|nr:MAG: outer membrane lipoprotein-sorting protein [Nitrospirota bacterium]